MALDRLIERTLALSEEQDAISRGKTTLSEQKSRRDRIFDLRRELKALDDEEVQDIYAFLSDVLMMENFSVSIPEGVHVREMHDLKSKDYGNGTEQEKRIYWSPHFHTRDIDGLSVVVALTPAKYTQPYHTHLQTTEFTLNTEGRLELLSARGGTEQRIEIPKGSIAVSPKGLAHTLSNPNSKRSANVSVKIPESMGDRHDIIDIGRYAVASDPPHIREPDVERDEGITVYRHELKDLTYAYGAELIELDTNNTYRVEAGEATRFYFVTDGRFTVKHRGHTMPAPKYSLITVDPNERALITAREEPGTIYTVRSD